LPIKYLEKSNSILSREPKVPSDAPSLCMEPKGRDSTPTTPSFFQGPFPFIIIILKTSNIFRKNKGFSGKGRERPREP
jgi:hypothetical protein